MKNRVKNGTYRMNPLFKRLMTFFVILFMAGAAFCEDFYFRGTGYWETDRAWTDSSGNALAGIPTATDNVFIVAGASCSATTDVTCNELNIESGGSLSVENLTAKKVTSNGSLYVGTSLLVNGTEDTDTLTLGGTFDFTSDASITTTKGFFNRTTISASDSKVLTITVEGFQNDGTFLMEGDSSSLHASRAIINNSSADKSKYGKVYIDFTNNAYDPFTFKGGEGTYQSISVENGPFVGKTVDLQSGHIVALDFSALTNPNVELNGNESLVIDNFTMAGVYTWTGSDSRSVTNNNNWSPEGVPGDGSTVLIPAGCSRYPLLSADFNLGDTGYVFVQSGAIFNLAGWTLTAKSGVKNAGTIISENVTKTGTIVGNFENTGIFQGNTGDTPSKINITGNAEFKNASAASFTANIEIAGNVTFSNTGNLSFEKDLTVTGDASFSGAGIITLGKKLTVNGNASLSGASVTANTDLEVTGLLSVKDGSSLKLAQSSSGTSTAGTFNITDSSSIDFGSNAASTFTVSSGNIDFSDAGSLTAGGHIKATAGKIVIAKDFSAGSDTAFESPVEFKTNDITVTSSDTGAKSLSFANTLTGDEKSFTAGSDSVPVNVEFKDTVSNLTFLTVKGTATLSSCTVTTTDDQSYLGNIVLSGTGTESTLNAGTDKNITLGKSGADPKNTVTGTGNKLVLGSSITLNQYSDISSDIKIASGKTVTLNTPLQTSGGLQLEGNIAAGANSITMGSSSSLTGTIGAGETYSGKVYITNKNSDEITINVNTDQKLSELYVAGNVNLINNVKVENVKYLHIQDDGYTQTADFNVRVTGEKTSFEKVDVTRSSTTDGIKGTLKIENDFAVIKDSGDSEYSGVFKTHSGTVVDIVSGGKLTAVNYIHSANSSAPETKVNVSGTLAADSILLVGNNNASGSLLTVNAVVKDEDENITAPAGTVNTKKLVVQNTYENGSLTNAVVNNGEIKVTGTADDDGLYLYAYSGSGKLTLSGKGKVVNNGTSDLTISELELKDIPSATVDAKGGNFTLTKLSVANTVTGTSSLTTSGTAETNIVTVKVFEGKLKNLTVSKGTLSLDESVTLIAAGDFTNSADGTLSGKGNLTVSGNFTDEGSWGTDAGTLTFNGSADQLLKFKTGTTYGPVVVDCGSGKTVYLGSNLKCAGVTIKKNATLKTEYGAPGAEENFDIETTGNFTNSGTYSATSGKLTVGRDLANNATGSFTAGSGAFKVTGDFINYAESPASFAGGSGTHTFSGNFTNSGIYTATSGTTNVGGIFTNSANGSYTAGSGTLSVNGTSVTDDTGTHLVGGNFTNSGTYSATTGSLSVAVDFTNETTGSFTAGTGNLTVGKDLVNNSTTTGNFAGGSGTHSVGGDLTNAGKYTASLGTTTVGGSFTNDTNGTFTAESGTLEVAKDFTNKAESPAEFSAGTGTVQFTVTGDHAVSGETTFYNLTCTEKGATISFESKKKQTVSNKFTVKGGLDDDEKVYVTLTSSGEDKWKIDVAPAKIDFKYVMIKNSESIQNIPGASPSVRLEHSPNNCIDCGNNIYWFAETEVYWHGGTDTDWDTPDNWKKDEEGTNEIIVVPSKTDPALKVYIVKDSSDSGKKTLTLDANISVSKFEVASGKNVVLGAYSVTADTITNNGIITVSGAIEKPLVKNTDGTITHADGSKVEFKNWTSGTAVETLSTGLGYTNGYGNLVVTGTGTFVFANKEGGEENPAVVVQGTFSTDASGIKAGSQGKINQTYKGDVTALKDVDFICDADNKITFEKTVTASEKLKVSGNAYFKNTVTAKEIEVTGKTEIETSSIETVSTAAGAKNTQKYTGDVTLKWGTTLTAEEVTFGSAVKGAFGLEVASKINDETNAVIVPGNLVVSAGDLDIASLSVAGTTSVQGTVKTSGAQNYSGNVTLSGDSNFTGSSVTFASTASLSGSHKAGVTISDVEKTAVFGSTVNVKNFTVTGNAEFNNTVTATTVLVTGTSEINTGSVTTSSTQEYRGKVTGSTDITFTAKDIASTPAVPKNITFGGAVESTGNLSFDGNVNAYGGTISNTGKDQEFNYAVTVNKTDAVFTGKNITFNGTLDSGSETVTEGEKTTTYTYGLSLKDSAGTVTFGGKVGSSVPLKFLAVEKAATVKCTDIKTSGTQTYSAIVTLEANSKFTGSTVTFEKEFKQKSGSTFAGTVDGNGVFGNSVTLDDLSVTGTSEINTDTITASSTAAGKGITLTGLVTLKKETALSGNNIKCPGGVTTGVEDASHNPVPQNMTLTATTKVVLGSSGKTSTLDTLVINSAGTDLAGTINTGIFNLNSDATSKGLVLKNSGLFTLYEGKTLTVAEDTVFTQSGTGQNLIKGSIVTSDTTSADVGIEETVVFNTAVYFAKNTGATLSLGGGKEKITLKDNLIICLSNASDSLTVSSPLSVKNLVLYKGVLNAGADISSSEDIVLLGSSYSSDDSEEKYTKKRRASYNYKGFDAATKDHLPDADSTALPGLNGTSLGGTLNVAAGKVINPGKNFYANGLKLHGLSDSDWYLDSGCNTDGSRFIEAYNCDLKRSVVRYKTADSTAENSDKACGLAQGCTFDGGTSWDENDSDNIGSNKNWNYPPFRIKSIETVSDNVIKVVFSEKIRNINKEVSDRPGKVLFDADKTFAAVYGSGSFNPDSGKWEGTLLGENEFDTVYFMTSSAEDTWNTDATGTSSGNMTSTNSHGVHKEIVPKIKFTRNVEEDIVFTNRVGKILTDSGTYWDKTLDSASPVLVVLKTGQEIHTPWDSSNAELSQPSYDAHNFVEFTFSEPVDIDNGSVQMPPFEADGTTTKQFENIRVEGELGALSEEGSGIEIAGFVKIASGKIKTGTEGVSDNTVHGFYRKDSMTLQQLRISVAGYTEGTVQDNDGNPYKKWIGYIEEAATPAGNVTLSNVQYIKDLKSNSLASVKNGGLSVTSDGGNDYGKWDVSKPEFVMVENQYEIIGSVVNGSAAIKRLEFHLFDNQYSDFKESQGASWIFRRGWVNSGTDTLKVSDSYASDCFGGARPFASTNRTSGGIRYSSVCEAKSSFSYKIGTDAAYSDFADKKSFYGATSPFFVSTKGTSRNPDSPDLPYFAFELPAYVQSLQTVFSLKFDKNQSYITDLAGNRLDQSMEMKSIDRTPPTFAMTIAPVGQKKLYIMFGKKIVLQGNISGKEEDGSSVEKEWNKALLEAFELGTISGSSFTPTVSSELCIDAAGEVKTLYFNDDYCGIELPLTREVTYKDIERLYIRAKPEATSFLDLTGLPSDTYTFIQDSLGNFMDGFTAHILSDFAVNLVNPLYAYNETVDAEGNYLQENLYSADSHAVHEWDAEQGNFGTLLTDKAIHVVSEIKDSELTADGANLFNIRGYFDNDPAAASVSKEYNSAAGAKLRVWLPEIPGLSVFETVSKTANSADVMSDSTYVQSGDLSQGLDLEIPESSVSSLWSNGNQVSFLFGIMENNGGTLENKKIDHSPVNNRDSYTVNKDSPFLALRLKNPDDILSLDLWSFRLKAQALQRGGVSIFNNVIDVTKGEKTVVKVDNPVYGRVEVIVMTLDGDVIDYLNHGNLKAGTTSFSWNGKNKAGKAVARGLYFVRVIGNGFDETRKVMVVK